MIYQPVQKSIDRLAINYSNARKSWEAWCFANNFQLKNSNPQVIATVDKNELLYHFRYLSLKDVYIELNKILGRDKGNLRHLLSQVPTKHPNKSKAIDILKNLEEHTETIKHIQLLRNKYYAHLDKEYKKYVSENASLFKMQNCFHLIEQGIIILTNAEYMAYLLDRIPSRDEFKLP